jgi:FkbM family methyltransferase
MIKKSVKIFGQKVDLTMRNDGDLAIADELFLERQYIFCEQTIDKAEKAIIDIGGHLGFFSLYASLINPHVPIYAFEPHAGNFELLKKNLKDNHIKNVTAKNLAVSDSDEEVVLKLSKEDLNHSIVHAIEDTGEVQKVGSITLEGILRKFELEEVDLLKLDAEGAEFQIIEGASDEVFEKIQNIFLEYHDWVPGGDHKRLQRFLEGQGYEVDDYPNVRMPELGFLWCRK